jgi:hypothetical protein
MRVSELSSAVAVDVPLLLEYKLKKQRAMVSVLFPKACMQQLYGIFNKGRRGHPCSAAGLRPASQERVTAPVHINALKI